MICSLLGAEKPGAVKTAVLVEGTAAVEGVPGFSANRIPALFGKYKTDDGIVISVWAVAEPLVFDPDVWSEKKAGEYSAFYSVPSGNSPLWAVRRTVSMREEMRDRPKWTFVFLFDGMQSELFYVSFIGVFIGRTEFFFSSARRVSDLSFPAALSVAGK
jgi:hypothetical protein